MTLAGSHARHLTWPGSSPQTRARMSLARALSLARRRQLPQSAEFLPS